MSVPQITRKVPRGENKLTVIGEPKRKRKNLFVQCRCACGTVKTIRLDWVGTVIKSCGCSRWSWGNGSRRLKKIYSVWAQMLARCRNKQHKYYSFYGGRGITVCDRWLEFKAFLSDMGEPPTGLSLERKDNNRGYEPENCVWATKLAQQRNMRSNRKLTIDGETLCIREWSSRSGVHNQTIRGRLERGWLPHRAVFTPIDTRCLHQ